MFSLDKKKWQTTEATLVIAKINHHMSKDDGLKYTGKSIIKFGIFARASHRLVLGRNLTNRSKFSKLRWCENLLAHRKQ